MHISHVAGSASSLHAVNRGGWSIKLKPLTSLASKEASRFTPVGKNLTKQSAPYSLALKSVAMEYSPNAEIPYISRVDAGTLEWIRSMGVEVHTSAELAQRMEARLNEAQATGHQTSAHFVLQAKDYAFAWIGSQLRDGKTITEYDVQQVILRQFDEMDLVTDHPPIVAANAKSSDPHYAPTPTDTQKIKIGDFILIDLWAKQKDPDAVFADTTWVAYADKTVPARYVEIFDIVKEARDRAVRFIREKWDTDAADSRLRSGRLRARVYHRKRIRRILYSSHWTQHRHRYPRERCEFR